jgi:hypothetical protein
MQIPALRLERTLEETVFRFSRNNRFGVHASYEEFMRIAQSVAEIAKREKPGVTVEVQVLLSRTSRNDRYVTPGMKEALKARKSFALGEFTKDDWKESSGVQLMINSPTEGDVFMCVVTWTWLQPERLYFYGQSGDEDDKGESVEQSVMTAFARGSFNVSIGQGFDGEDLMISKRSLTASAA